MSNVLPLNQPKRKKYAKVPASDERPGGPFIPYLLLNLDSGIYYVRKTKAGKGELFASTGETKKGRAKAKMEIMIAEWLGVRGSVSLRRPRFSAVCEELLSAMKQELENGDRAVDTHGKDRTYIPLVSKLFGDCMVDELDEVFWEDWVRTTGKKMDRTLFDIAKYLSKVLTYAWRRGYINRKPRIVNPDSQEKTAKVPTSDQIAAVLAQCDLPLLCQTYLGGENGMRTHEVRGLRWDQHVIFAEDEAGKEITVIRFGVDKAGKRKGQGREFQVSQNASQLLRRLYARRNPESPYVFPMPTNPLRPQTKVHQNRKWRRAVKAAGIRGSLWFYWLRHYFYTTTLLELGLPIQQVSEFGGTSIRTLQKRYLHSNAKRTRAVGAAIDFGTWEKSVKKGG
jgi:integrase